MTQFNPEGPPEGDWEERGNLSWSELDWQQFLFRQEKEVARFLGLYDACPAPATERLDWVARQMGWDAQDWSVSEFGEDDAEAGETDPEGSGDPPDPDPYTLHRHPVYVVTTGLFMQLRYHWRAVLEACPHPLDALQSWDFAESLNEAERHSLLAMQCMDVGDFLLCVVHLKRALRGLNLAMTLLPGLLAEAPVPAGFEQGLRARLFDLREVFLRVMMDCRDEEFRDFRD